MTKTRRVGVLFTPSPLEPLWRDALSQRATELGWRIIDATAFPEVLDPAGDGDVVIMAGDMTILGTHYPAQCVVLTDTPDAAARLMGLGVDAPALAATSQSLASARYAMAAHLAQEGHSVHDAREQVLDLPGLGEVRRAAAPARLDGPGQERPLAIFDRLPIPVGTFAEWAPALFTYPLKTAPEGGSPVIDMTGRVRPLVHGPNIDLPPGAWRAQLMISVDPEGGHAHLRVEWGANSNFVASNVEITRPGLYSMALDKVWVEIAPAQLRLWIPQPLFQGRMEFLGCRVIRMPNDTPETTGR